MEKVITSKNFYIDTVSANEESNSFGDDYQLNLASQSMKVGQGQAIRLNLQEFSMYKTFTDVNSTNNQFVLTTNRRTTGSVLSLTKQNYTSIYNLASDFATVLGAQLLTDALVGSSSSATKVVIQNLLPSASQNSPSATTNNIISFTVSFQNNSNVEVAHNLDETACHVKFFEQYGDVFALLRGDRVIEKYDTATNTAVDSIKLSQGTTYTMLVECLYPAQRNTCSHIYLRTSVDTMAGENAGLNQFQDVRSVTDMLNSNILAKIAVDTEMCNFLSGMGREYFIDLNQKSLTTLRLYLTDHRNRRIGRIGTETTTRLTASGVGTQQSKLGNLSFSCVIKVDVIQKEQEKERFTNPPVSEAIPRQIGLQVYPDKKPF